MAETKRTRRTSEEIAAARQEKVAQLDKKVTDLEALIQEIEQKKAAAVVSFDEKIAAANTKIEKVKKQKENLLAPKKPAAKKPVEKKAKKPGRRGPKKRRTQNVKIQEMIKQARRSGMKLEEIAEKLGVEVDQ